MPKRSGKKRKEIRLETKRIRFRQLKARDGTKCWLCGLEMKFKDKVNGDPRIASIDHVIPISKGGTHNINNLKLACHKCNSERDF